MSTSVPLDELLDRVTAGGELAAEELGALGESSDILAVGMIADALRRRRHGRQVTYVRVAHWPHDAPLESVPPAAREIRITGAPDTLDVALRAVEAARELSQGRSLSGFSWCDIERIGSGTTMAGVLAQLRSAGLDAIAHVPLDAIASPAAALGLLADAGYERVRVSIDKAAAVDTRVALMREAAVLQQRLGCIHAINPLPSTLGAFRPTTGYDDVKSVALARLAAPNVPCVQIDWLRYGPKLAQVALTFGADDVDEVTASDAAPDGRRRAPLEEVRRNITAAGFEPVERDGRFAAIA